jgi:NAD(P)-dependent dehydrogenase (short-subunit alcohol dehydrogenase family)
MDLHLRHHVAVVTGGASGIGRAIAEAFAAEGAAVALWDRSSAVSRSASELSDQTGVKTLGLAVDVTDEAAVMNAAERTSSELGAIDHLAHAAAIGSGKFGFPFTNLQPADWRQTLEVNIMGMVNVAHALAPAMVERRKGTLTFIASVAGQMG